MFIPRHSIRHTSYTFHPVVDQENYLDPAIVILIPYSTTEGTGSGPKAEFYRKRQIWAFTRRHDDGVSSI